jgi:hypothetical protein
MEGTRLNILQYARDWSRDLNKTQIFCLSDVAGSGKSTIAKHLAEEWRKEGRLAGSFFFSRGTEYTRTFKYFFSTIAQQGISRLGPAVQTAVADGIRKLRNPISSTLVEQHANIFMKPLGMLQVELPMVLVVDALDECEPESCRHLLEVLLENLRATQRLKLFLTSRPETRIMEQLRTYHLDEASLRADNAFNLRDVEIYMREKFQKTSLQEEQVAQLIERADGLFIWARTVCGLLHNLRGNKNHFIDRVLSKGVRQMDSIYRIALEQAIGENQAEEGFEAYMNVLKLLVAAYEPLSPNAIDRLLNSTDSLQIIRDLGSVLDCEGEDSIVRFLHPTFRDFLLDSPDANLYHIHMDEAHHLLGSSCLSIMLDDLHHDLCELYQQNPTKFKPEDLNSICLEYTSPALRYSCRFWGNHIVLDDQSLFQQYKSSIIESFFSSKLLDWIYMVGMQQSIGAATRILRGLISDNAVGY